MVAMVEAIVDRSCKSTMEHGRLSEKDTDGSFEASIIEMNSGTVSEGHGRVTYRAPAPGETRDPSWEDRLCVCGYERDRRRDVG